MAVSDSSSPVSFAVPVVLLLICIVGTLVAIVWLKRYVCYVVEFYCIGRANCKAEYALEFYIFFLIQGHFSPVWSLLKYCVEGS